MIKWKLLLTTLPYVAAVTVVKALLEFLAHWGGVVDFGDIGPVLTGGVFLTGILLAGVMTDYKESEKLPGELAGTLEGIEEICLSIHAEKPTIALAPLHQGVHTLTARLRDWIFKRATTEDAHQAITSFHGLLVQATREGSKTAGVAMGEVAKLRKCIQRIDVISRTGFLPPAYALLESMNVIIIGLALAAKFKTTLAEFILVPFITLIYVYMLRLIRDIDDPFDYASDGKQQGGAEVDLYPLEEYWQRLCKRVTPG